MKKKGLWWEGAEARGGCKVDIVKFTEQFDEKVMLWAHSVLPSFGMMAGIAP